VPRLPERIVLASANPKKAAEMARIFGELGVQVDGRPVELVARPGDVAEVVEDADDFLGNARLKAVALADATGLPALADDSGLEVDALGGAPGVRSARYSDVVAGDVDSANVAKLLVELERVGASGSEARTARFRTAIVLRWPDGQEQVAEGAVEGVIIDAPQGTGGFGYDPVFAPAEGDGRTFAEMAPEQKHAISHRGRALRALAHQLLTG
jgi:XTP/dITP diphosphohydrolase